MNPPVDVWLRGPAPGIPPVLQPVAHALLQVREDVRRLAADLPAETLHARPGGSASIAFHLLHLANVADRLFTYARGEKLSEAQRAGLREEREGPDPARDAASLVGLVEETVDRSLADLGKIPESKLHEARAIGSAGLPASVLGILFHAAEHSTRHAGQVATLVRVLEGNPKAG